MQNRSRNSYTSSERRGILAIALVSLLLIGTGLGFTLCERKLKPADDYPIVTTMPEMVDSTKVIEMDQTKGKKKKGKRIDKSKPVKKTPKVFPKRSPLDEPV